MIAFRQLQIITSFLALELRSIWEESLGQFHLFFFTSYSESLSFNSTFPRYSTLFSHLCYGLPFGIHFIFFGIHFIWFHFISLFKRLSSSIFIFSIFTFITAYSTLKRRRQNVTTEIVSSVNSPFPTLMCKSHNVVYDC